MRWVLALVLLSPLPVAACPSCASGDPALAVMGSEPLFAGRTRVAVDLRLARTQGTGGEQVEEIAGRLTASVAPLERLSLWIAAPLVYRHALLEDAARARVIGPGDLEIGARLELLRDRAVFPTHRAGLSLGVRLPTSIDQVDPQGNLLPIEAQTGDGAIGPGGGVWTMHSADPWTAFTSWQVRLPFANRWPVRPGPSMLASLALHLRVAPWLTLRAAVETRFDAPLAEDGQMLAGTQSFALWAGPGVLLALGDDVVLALLGRLPALATAEPGRSEGWSASVSVIVDA